MRNRLCGFLVAAVVLSTPFLHAATPVVDPALVGTWEMVVQNPTGPATWIWEVRADGTYSFHSEGPGDAPSNHGTFTASNGSYLLTATDIDWNDRGTYDPPANNILRATGKLGTGFWKRRVTDEPKSDRVLKTSDELNSIVKRAGFVPKYSSYLKTFTTTAKAASGEEFIQYGIEAKGDELLFIEKVRNLTPQEEKDSRKILQVRALRMDGPCASLLKPPMDFHIEDETTFDLSNAADVEHPKWIKYQALTVTVEVVNRGVTPADISSAITRLTDVVACIRSDWPAPSTAAARH